MIIPDERRVNATLGKLLGHRGVGMLLVAATIGLSLWFNLGGTTLLDPDEGRHSSIAREMLASGQWLTPTLNGHPYHDKPVLFYWLAAASLHVFGHDAWSMRLPSAVAAAVTILATTWWGMRLIDPLTGTLAGLILATAGLWFGLGRLAFLDMLYSGWMTSALLYGSAWVLRGRERGWAVWPVYALLALATLTKGPAAPVLASIILIGLTYRTGAPWRPWQPLRGVVVFAAVAGTWFVAAALVSPQYVYDFIWTHNVERFVDARVGHRLSVVAYFYWLPVTFLPWSLYWPGVIHALNRRGLRNLPVPVTFCLMWAAVVFLFFTASAAKLPTYMLPLFPPAALLTAFALREAFQAEDIPRVRLLGYRVAFHAVEALAIGLAITSVVMGYLFWPHAIVRGLLPVALTMPVPVALGHLALRRNNPALLVPTTYVLMLCLLFGLYGWFLPWLEDVYSLGTPARLTRLLPPERRVFTVDTPPGSLSFYTERPVQRLDTLSEAAARLNDAEPTAIVTKIKRLPELASLLPAPAYIWWESPRIKVLVVNRPPPEGSGIPVIPLSSRS